MKNDKAVNIKTDGTRLGKKINVYLSASERGVWRKVTRTLSTVTCDKCGVCSLYAKGKCLNVADPVRKGNTCKFGFVHSATFDHLSSSRSHALLKACEKDAVYNALSYPEDWVVEFVDDVLFLDLRFAICDKQAYVSGHLVESKDYHIRIPESILGWYSAIPMDKMTPSLLNEIATFGSHLSDVIANEYNTKIVPEVISGVKKILPDVYKDYIEKYVSLQK